jgi:hypothetical protein
VTILLAGRPRNWGSVPGSDKRYFYFHSFQTDCGAHTASHPRRKGLKLSGRRAEKSTSSSSEIKNAWRYTSSSQMSSWHGATRHRAKFAFTIVKIFIEKVIFIQMVTNSAPFKNPKHHQTFHKIPPLVPFYS